MKRRIIRLAPQVSAWCDAKNNIYLSKNGRKFKELKEDCDMKAINKGVKAGLIILEEHEEEEVKKVEIPKEEPVAIEVQVASQNIIEKAKAKAKKAARAKAEKVEEVEEVKEEVVEEENKDNKEE